MSNPIPCFACFEKTVDIVNELLKIFGEADESLDRDLAVLKLVLDSFEDNRITNKDWGNLRIAFASAIDRIEARLKIKSEEE